MRYALAGTETPVICALMSHRRFCAASSVEADDEGMAFDLSQYLPVTPSTSGEDAR